MPGSGRDNFTPAAEQVPFDNETNGFISEDTQAAIEEVKSALLVSASPGFTWGKSGNTTSNSWLLNDSVPSNKAGRAIFVINPTLESVFIRCESPATFDIEIYEHDGTTFTLITTVNIIAARGGNFNIASLPLTSGKELALKLVNGSAKNPVAGCIIKGNI